MCTAQAASYDVQMNVVSVDETPQAIGVITVTQTPYGLMITPHLKNLPIGTHDFHVHENGSCEAGGGRSL